MILQSDHSGQNKGLYTCLASFYHHTASVDIQVEVLRESEQFSKCLHSLTCLVKDSWCYLHAEVVSVSAFVEMSDIHGSALQCWWSWSASLQPQQSSLSSSSSSASAGESHRCQFSRWRANQGSAANAVQCETNRMCGSLTQLTSQPLQCSYSQTGKLWLKQTGACATVVDLPLVLDR